MKADYVILSIDNSGSMYTANLGVEGDGTGGYEQFTDWVVDTEDGLGAALVENEYFGLEYWIDWINTGIEDLLE